MITCIEVQSKDRGFVVYLDEEDKTTRHGLLDFTDLLFYLDSLLDIRQTNRIKTKTEVCGARIRVRSSFSIQPLDNESYVIERNKECRALHSEVVISKDDLLDYLADYFAEGIGLLPNTVVEKDIEDSLPTKMKGTAPTFEEIEKLEEFKPEQLSATAQRHQKIADSYTQRAKGYFAPRPSYESVIEYLARCISASTSAEIGMRQDIVGEYCLNYETFSEDREQFMKNMRSAVEIPLSGFGQRTLDALYSFHVGRP